MFAYYPDQFGNTQWQMMPYYQSYFYQFLDLIKILRDTVNKKWKEEQLYAYNTYLNDLESYIVNYIFTGVVYDMNQFEVAMEAYGTTTNSLGKELYQSQVDYMAKK